MTQDEKDSITKKMGEFEKSLKDQAKTWENIATRDSLSVLKKAMRLLGQEKPSTKDLADLASEYATILRYEQMSNDYEQIEREFTNKFREIYWIKVDAPKEETK